MNYGSELNTTYQPVNFPGHALNVFFIDWRNRSIWTLVQKIFKRCLKIVSLQKKHCMKTLTLHIDETIYNDVKRFLSLFSNDRLQIKEENAKNTSLSYDQFEKNWAGLLQNDDIGKNWKDGRIDFLIKKHS